MYKEVKVHSWNAEATAGFVKTLMIFLGTKNIDCIPARIECFEALKHNLSVVQRTKRRENFYLTEWGYMGSHPMSQLIIDAEHVV